MPRVCSLCTHPDRLAIETALGSTLPLRTIAARWSVSKTALLRHRERHRSPPVPVSRAGPPGVKPATGRHTLTACAAALLAHCFPEVRARFADVAAYLELPLETLVVAGLHEYIRHLDQCPHYLSGPEA